MLRRIPYVHYAADIWSDASESTTAPKLVVRAVRGVERSVVTHADAVLSVSEGVSDRLRTLGASSNIATVGNGIDTGVFTADGQTEAPGSPYFVYAGTASEIQGAAVFIEAFEQVLASHPDARLVFIGLGVDLPLMEAAAARLPAGTVTFRGRLPGAETAQWLRGARASLASVRPGLGYDFMIPTKIYASVACGTPVIYAGPGPSRILVADNGLGYAVDHDVAQVAAAMQTAMETEASAAERQRLSGWAVDFVSLATVGDRAADVVLRAARARTRSLA
jgi:glycosyltransferase involved in cell wall biosynthesis